MTLAVRAIAYSPSGGKRKAKNHFCLSDKAYKVTIDIAYSRLQVAPAPSAAVDSVLPGMRSPPANPASRHVQPLVSLSSASAEAAGLSGRQMRRRAYLGGLNQAPAVKKLKAWRDSLSGIKLSQKRAMTTDCNAVSLALKLIKASEKLLKAMVNEQKEIEKKNK